MHVFRNFRTHLLVQLDRDTKKESRELTGRNRAIVSDRMKLSEKLLLGILLLVCVGLSTQFPSRGRHDHPPRRDHRAEGEDSAGGRRSFGRRETDVERRHDEDWDRRRFPGDPEGRHDKNDRRPGHHNRPDENDRRQKQEGEERRKGGHKPKCPLVCLVQFTNGTVKQMWACPPRTTCNKGPHQIKHNRTDIGINLHFCTRINGSKPGCDGSEETTEKRPDNRPDERFDDDADCDRPMEEDAEEDKDDDSSADDDDDDSNSDDDDSNSDDDDGDDHDDRHQGKNHKGSGRGSGRRGRRGGRGGRRGGRGRGRGRRHPFPGPRPLGCRLVKADGNVKFKRDCPKQLQCDSRPQTWNITGGEMKARFCVYPHGKPTRGNRSHSIAGPSRFQEPNKRQGPQERRENHEGGHQERFPLVCLIEFTNGTVTQMWACPPRTTCNTGPRQVFNNRTHINMNLYFCSRIDGSKPDCDDSEESSEERDESRSGEKVDDEDELKRFGEDEEEYDDEEDNSFEDDNQNDDRHDRQDNKFKGRSIGRRSRGEGHGGRHSRSGPRKGGRRPFPHHRPIGCRLIKADGKEKFRTYCPWQFECNTNWSQTWNISGEEMKAYFCVPPHHVKPTRNGQGKDQDDDNNDHDGDRDWRPESGKGSRSDHRRQGGGDVSNAHRNNRDDGEGNDNRDRRPEGGKDGERRSSRPCWTRGRRGSSRGGNSRPRGGHGRPRRDRRG